MSVRRATNVVFFIALVVSALVGTNALGIDNPTLPSLQSRAPVVVSSSSSSSSGGGIGDNTNIAYLNNTQTFTAVNNFSSQIQLSTAAKIISRATSAIKTILWEVREI